MLTSYLSEWTFCSQLLRMLLAMLIGTIIGFNRKNKNRNAGIKTHVLVCLGAALIMLTSQYMFITFPSAKADIARMGAQVISGVGFLGAGTILVTNRRQIKGLTTAAGLWTCACAGIAIGIGYLEGSLLILIFCIITFTVLDHMDARIRKNARNFDLYIEFRDNRCLKLFVNLIHHQKAEFYNLNLIQRALREDGSTLIISIAGSKDFQKQEFLKELQNADYIDYYEEI